MKPVNSLLDYEINDKIEMKSYKKKVMIILKRMKHQGLSYG